MKIILLSGDAKTSKKISQNKTMLDNELEIQSTRLPLKLKIEQFNLIILNIYKKDFEVNGFCMKILDQISNFNIPVLLVLSIKHAELISLIQNAGFKTCDILFRERLEEELGLRINFLTLSGITNRRIQFHSENSIIVGGLVLDRDKYEVSINGKRIELTFKEYELCKILLENQNKVFSRNKLLSTVWGYDFYGGSRTVDVHMRRLRSKLDPPYSDMLKTVRNAGYLFSPHNQ